MRDATVPCERSTNRRSRVVSSPCSRPRLVDDDERADAGGAHTRRGVGEARVGGDRVGIADDAVLLALDDLDLAHLRLDLAAAEAAVDDADAAFLGHRDRHLGSRHRVHVGRDDRTLQRQAGARSGR